MKLFVVLVFAIVFAIGCTPYSTLRDVPIDCDVMAKYDLKVETAFQWDTLSPEACQTTTPAPSGCPGWTAADGSLNAVMTAAVVTIPDRPRCDSTAALVLTADNNNEWGSLFGLNDFTMKDGSEHEGLTFWARVANHRSNTAFTILIGDPNSFNSAAPVCDTDGGMPAASPSDAGMCTNYCIADGGIGVGTTDPSTGMTIPGTVTDAPEPDQCGNDYRAIEVVSPYWRLYTIPFAEFQQAPTPNRAPNAALTQTGSAPGTALRTSSLSNFRIRMPKGTRTELWIDNLGFYRKATATGGDGGADAAQM